MNLNRIIYIIISIALFSCEKTPEKLPILGHREPVAEGSQDTIYHSIPDFSFVDQDGKEVNASTIAGKVYITDFFFTTCPTICPVMKKNLLKVYEKYNGSDKVVIISHSIDPVHDSVAVLKDYADRLGVKSDTWHFVTGEKDSIYAIAKSYLVSAQEDKDAPGGYIHSGALVLLDTQRRIRGYYDGTEDQATDKLLEDIQILLNEK